MPQTDGLKRSLVDIHISKNGTGPIYAAQAVHLVEKDQKQHHHQQRKDGKLKR